MKNKRNLFARLLSVVMLLSLCCLFAACHSDSEEKDDISSSDLSSILRKSKWVNRDYYFDAGGAYAELSQTTDYYYFISDTEGILCHYYKWIDTSGIDDQGLNSSYIFFTYTISGNKVSIKKEDGYSQSFVYDGEFLKSGNDYYRPVTPSAGDWEQIAKIKEKHKYEGDYEFNYTLQFSPELYSYYDKSKYHHLIRLALVTPENTFIRGVLMFGVAIIPTNGEISYKRGYSDNIWVEKRFIDGTQAICYTGSLIGNSQQSWVTDFIFVSTTRTARFRFAPIICTDKNEWKTLKSFTEYEYVPDGYTGDSDGNDNTPSGGPHTGSANGHEYVDLGLPSGTLWATCNVGASKPEDYGNYYAWGETDTKSVYSWDTYKYGRSNNDVDNIGSDIAGTNYDVAHVKWGGLWRMPTVEQCNELYKNTKWIWFELNGIKGMKFTGNNGTTLFIPAAGYYDENGIKKRGENGRHWSSVLNKNYTYTSEVLFFRPGVVDYRVHSRYEGCPVRPVLQK